MRFAILSDIQGNITALRAVLNEIAAREDVGDHPQRVWTGVVPAGWPGG